MGGKLEGNHDLFSYAPKLSAIDGYQKAVISLFFAE